MTQHLATTIQCYEALEIFQKKDFSEWTGLPSTCLLSDLLQLWAPADEGAMIGPLGDKRISTSYRYCSVPGYNDPVRVWTMRGRILQIDVEDPLPDYSARTLLEQLGAPEAKIDATYGFAYLGQGEWFYGERGLSLIFMAEDDRIKTLSVFVSSDIYYYIDLLRIERDSRPLPKRVRQ